MTTRTWWFEDTETGEEFFVENKCADRSTSKAEAQVSLASAEAMGYDTY